MEDDDPEIDYDVQEEVYSDPENDDNNTGEQYKLLSFESLDKERENKIN